MVWRFVSFVPGLAGRAAGVRSRLLVRTAIHGLWRELVLRLYLGYGERPDRVLLVAMVVLIGSTIGYWRAGTFVLDPQSSPLVAGHPQFEDALYFSLVSFVALGYGNWVLQPVGWSQWLGAVESVLGIFSVVFFSITFAQNSIRNILISKRYRVL